jgi:hypothetical protein
MKKLVLMLSAAVLLLSGCISSKQYYEKGEYDKAISKAVKRLKKNTDRPKEVWVLLSAYKTVNQADLDRISYLKQTGQPDIWDEVFQKYDLLKKRQDLVKTLPQKILDDITFNWVNYDKDVIESQKKAVEYYYTHARVLLEKKDKMSARQAYDELRRIKDFYENYKDVDAMLQTALELGTTNVIFKMNNQSMSVLPQGFEDELLTMTVKDLNRNWINYDSREVSGRTYDYMIFLNLKMIDVSPEHIKQFEYTESREVKDGFQYVLDAHGNVMKDSLGNDIKVQKYKTITCHVLETQMNKEAIITGTVDFYDNRNSQLLRNEKITAESHFNYMFATAMGDIDALKKETAQKLNRPVPFPNDLEMIGLASEYLKDAARSIISNNAYILK